MEQLETRQPTSEDQERKEELSSILNDLLLDDNYSTGHLVDKAREKNLNLRELHDELVKHQQKLHQTSLELFNTKHDQFFELSHLITCLAEPMKHVIDPIENYRDQLGKFCDSHDNYLQDIDKKLAALEDTSKNKLFAKKLLTLIRRRDRIFKQINSIEWLKYLSMEPIVSQQKSESFNNSIAFKVNCDTIERLFIELHYLQCETRAIKPTSDELIPIKNTLEASVSEQQRRLSQWFGDLYQHANEVQCQSLVDFIDQTYEQLK